MVAVGAGTLQELISQTRKQKITNIELGGSGGQTSVDVTCRRWRAWRIVKSPPFDFAKFIPSTVLEIVFGITFALLDIRYMPVAQVCIASSTGQFYQRLKSRLPDVSSRHLYHVSYRTYT